MNVPSFSHSKKVTRLKDRYWAVVEDCLVEFLEIARRDAQARCAELRKKLDNPPRGLMNTLYLHEEPFYMACDLAENELDPSQYREQYDLILHQHKW